MPVQPPIDEDFADASAFGAVIAGVEQGDVTVIHRGGAPVAVILGYADYQALKGHAARYGLSTQADEWPNV